MSHEDVPADDINLRLGMLRRHVRQYRRSIKRRDIASTFAGFFILHQVNKLQQKPLTQQQKIVAGMMMAHAVAITDRLDPAQIKVPPRKNFFAIEGEKDQAKNLAAAIEGTSKYRNSLMANFACQMSGFVHDVQLSPLRDDRLGAALRLAAPYVAQMP